VCTGFPFQVCTGGPFQVCTGFFGVHLTVMSFPQGFLRCAQGSMRCVQGSLGVYRGSFAGVYRALWSAPHGDVSPAQLLWVCTRLF